MLSQPHGRSNGGTRSVCFGNVGRELSVWPSSLDGKTAGLLHRCQQLLVELLVGLIGWNVDPIKAGVGLWKVVGVGIDEVDGEEPGPCRACRALPDNGLVNALRRQHPGLPRPAQASEQMPHFVCTNLSPKKA